MIVPKSTTSNSTTFCPKCKLSLPSDSEYCQVCGTKLSALACFPQSTDDTPEELLSETEFMAINGSSPILIQRAKLFSSSDREKVFLRCEFKSLSQRVISALMIDVFCFDVWGNELPTIHDAQILDLNAHKNDIFGLSSKVPIIDPNTRTVKVRVKRIKYIDGTIDSCSDEEINIPKLVSLSDYFKTSTLIDQYTSLTSEEASFVPINIGEFWICSCGEINSQSQIICDHCTIDKQIVFDALNESYLNDNYPEYVKFKQLQSEQKLREIEAEKRAKEKERMAQLQIERNLAIQKRIIAAELADKRKKRIRNIIIVCIVTLLLILIARAIRNEAYRSESRNFATETMDDSFTNVYANVVSVKPEYFIYQYSTTKSGMITYNGFLSEVVCKCKTVEGKYIWVSFFYQRYPGASYSQKEKDYKDLSYSTEAPLKLVGSVQTARQVCDDLEKSIGNTYVLDVRSTVSN